MNGKILLWLAGLVIVSGSVFGAWKYLSSPSEVALSPEAGPAAVEESFNAATSTASTTTPETPKVASSTPHNTSTTTPKPAQPSTNTNLNIVKHLLLEANSEPRTTPITHVLIHFISNVSNKQADPYNPGDIISIFLASGLSSHYLIERDGTIYWLTSEKRVAYHAGKGQLAKFPEYTDKMNLYSIGIEMAAIGTKEEMAEFIGPVGYDALAKKDIGYTDAQYTALNGLLGEIYKRYPTIKHDRDHVIGHDEYAPGRKHDPGSLFDWSRIGF